MKHTEIIKAIMRKEGVTLTDIAVAIGMAGPSGVSRIINRKNGTIMPTTNILDALGYEMVIRPAKKAPLAENEYVLHFSDYQEEDER